MIDSITMELIDGLATELVEERFERDTYVDHGDGDIGFSEDAQDYYNEVYDRVESLVLGYHKETIKNKLS